MSKTSAVAICILLSACATTPTGDKSALDEAKAVVASHENFVRTGDLNGIMTNVAEDVVVLAPNAPLIKGKSAVREMYASMLQGGTFEFIHDYEGAEISGDTVILHGVARGRFVPSTGQSSAFANNFVIVVKRQPTGSFQFWRVAFGPSGSSS